MSTIKNSICLLLCLFLFACSSTDRFSGGYFNENGYARGFVTEHFSNGRFIPADSKKMKKPLGSDHQLMMALLNRPITTDQAMMLAFAQERASYSNSYSNYNYAVEIKGEKSSDQPNYRAKHAYSKLISQDINAVSISAPK